MGIGGSNADLPGIKKYIQHHKEVMGREPDRWASPITYASLQVLQQAIEKVGKIDREAVIKEINTGTFDTIIGKIQLKDNLYKGVWAVGQWQGDELLRHCAEAGRRARPDRAEAGLAVAAALTNRCGVRPCVNARARAVRARSHDLCDVIADGRATPAPLRRGEGKQSCPS